MLPLSYPPSLLLMLPPSHASPPTLLPPHASLPSYLASPHAPPPDAPEWKDSVENGAPNVGCVSAITAVAVEEVAVTQFTSFAFEKVFIQSRGDVVMVRLLFDVVPSGGADK